MPHDSEDAKEKSERSEREERRRRFARALARDAFGRNYWDEGKAKELRRAATQDRAKRDKTKRSP